MAISPALRGMHLEALTDTTACTCMRGRCVFYLVARWTGGRAIPFFRGCGTDEEAKTLLRDLRRQARADRRKLTARLSAIGLQTSTPMPAPSRSLAIQWQHPLANERSKRKWEQDYKQWSERTDSFQSVLGTDRIDPVIMPIIFRDERRLLPLRVFASTLAVEIIGDLGGRMSRCAASDLNCALTAGNNAGASVGTVQIINNCETIMQFNQTNKNVRDVNNAISEKGDVIQTAGTHNTVHARVGKETFWEALWSKIKACWKWLRG